MRVRDLLERKPSTVVTVEPGVRVDLAIGKMVAHDVGGLPVTTAGGKLVGFVDEREIVRALRSHGGTVYGLRVEQVMRPPTPCEADDDLEVVMRRMTDERRRHLVVRDGERVVGVVSVGDIVKDRLDQLRTERDVLRDYLAGQRISHR